MIGTKKAEYLIYAELTGWSAKEIADQIGMSYRWVTQYLSTKYKKSEPEQLASARHSLIDKTQDIEENDNETVSLVTDEELIVVLNDKESVEAGKKDELTIEPTTSQEYKNQEMKALAEQRSTNRKVQDVEENTKESTIPQDAPQSPVPEVISH